MVAYIEEKQEVHYLNTLFSKLQINNSRRLGQNNSAPHQRLQGRNNIASVVPVPGLRPALRGGPDLRVLPGLGLFGPGLGLHSPRYGLSTAIVTRRRPSSSSSSSSAASSSSMKKDLTAAHDAFDTEP
ncbi:hypothetical protein B0T24DRAFT_598130 [Lasiosphaeria ovina]|uniref:Uncharacterized protein n=1 Tax=Lasiosphaeria ovina TaxID=92902 RepID=A0AAE0MZN5_9PEZI|nr:hypothetical protein B0T24DRAFT_598130 [Lasiosphaeria ovina]